MRRPYIGETLLPARGVKVGRVTLSCQLSAPKIDMGEWVTLVLQKNYVR